MTTGYYLRDFPSDFWRRAITKAHGEGRTIKWVILRLLERWMAGEAEL